MGIFTVDVNSAWFAALVFGLYSVYQFVFYEFFRYYPLTITLLFMVAIAIFAPFLIWPIIDIYRIFLYFAVSCFFLYVATVRVVYFNHDHEQVNKNRFQKALHVISSKLYSKWNSPEEDFDETKKYFYNKLTALIIYCSLVLHILMFIVIDLVNKQNIGNIICGVLLFISVPLPWPNSIFAPILHTVYIETSYFELLVPLLPGWILLYSLWFLLFIASWKSCIECHLHVAILVIIPLIRSFHKKRYHLWYTSFLFGIASMTVFTQPFYPYFLNSNEIYYMKYVRMEPSFETANAYENVLDIWGLINALYAIAYFLYYAKKIYDHWLMQQRQLRKQSLHSAQPAATAADTQPVTNTKETQAILDQTAQAYKQSGNHLNTKTKVSSFSPSSAIRESQSPKKDIRLQIDQQRPQTNKHQVDQFANAHYNYQAEY